MSIFVKLNDAGEIEKYPYTVDMFRYENKNVSLPRILNNRFLEQRNIHPVYEDEIPNYNNIVQQLVKNSEPVYKNGRWVTEWSVETKSQETIDAEKLILETEIRDTRDKKLEQTDWVAVKAFEEGISISQEWKDYRQALRDITAQADFPYTVSWPAEPA